MGIGVKIKIALLEKKQSQKWLSDATGINYDRLNSSLNGNRELNYDELSVILWALDKQASEFIQPFPPNAHTQ